MRRIFSGPAGFLEGDVNGKLFIEMSTLQPMQAGRELAPLVEAKGARMIEAPVLGTIAQAREGDFLAMVGGRPEDLERARPVMEKLTGRIAYMGPSGAGYAMKLAADLELGSYVQALAESLALGWKQGLTLEQMLDVIADGPYASGWLKSKLDVFKGGKAEMTLDIRALPKGSHVGGGDRSAERRADAVGGRNAGFAVGGSRCKLWRPRHRRAAEISARDHAAEFRLAGELASAVIADACSNEISIGTCCAHAAPLSPRRPAPGHEWQHLGDGDVDSMERRIRHKAVSLARQTAAPPSFD